MSLGIYDRLWELLEAACTQLDLLLAKHSSVGGLENSYDKYVAALKEKERLYAALATEEQRVLALDQLVTFLSIQLPNPASNQQLLTIRTAASKTILAVNALVF